PAEVDVVLSDVEDAELLQAVERDGQGCADVPEVELDTPVGRPGDQLGTGMVGEQLKCLGEIERTDVFALSRGDLCGQSQRGRSLAPGQQRIVRCGPTERVRGVADWPVAGAPAEVSTERMQIEAIGSV